MWKLSMWTVSPDFGVLSHKRQNTTGILMWASEEKRRHNSALRHPKSDWVKKVLLCVMGVCCVEGLFSSVSCSWISSVLGQLTNSCKNNNYWSEGKQDRNAMDFHRTSCFLAMELFRELWESERKAKIICELIKLVASATSAYIFKLSGARCNLWWFLGLILPQTYLCQIWIASSLGRWCKQGEVGEVQFDS